MAGSRDRDGGGKKKKKGVQMGHDKGTSHDHDKRGDVEKEKKDAGPTPIQEQVLQVDVNVKKIILPKNHTAYLVNRLRNINKCMSQLKEL